MSVCDTPAVNGCCRTGVEQGCLGAGVCGGVCNYRGCNHTRALVAGLCEGCFFGVKPVECCCVANGRCVLAGWGWTFVCLLLCGGRLLRACTAVVTVPQDE